MEPDSHVVQSESEPRAEKAVTTDDFERLDPRVVRFWALSAGFGTGLVLLLALVGGVVLWTFTGFPRFIIVGVWLWLGLTFFFEASWLPRRRYEATSFRLSPTFYEFRSGVYWRTSVMIPISRLQHIDLLRGPLERRFGLATLEIYTAGTRNASHKIAGVQFDRALELRRRMIEAAELEAE